MRTRMRACGMGAGFLLGSLPCVGLAQFANPEDDNVEAISRLTSISQLDLDNIARWIGNEVDHHAELAQTDPAAAFDSFRERVMRRFADPDNNPAFAAQLAAQAAKVAEARFAAAQAEVAVARALARVLLEMDRREAIPGFVAGLRLEDAAARFICVKGLAQLGNVIAADRNELVRIVEALGRAGAAESSPVVLAQVYVALSFPGQVETVFDPFLEIFDRRLAARRQASLVADGAEIEAYEFFRTPAVRNALNNEQKARLVARVATFLRLDAERYATADLPFEEQSRIEQLLWAGEEILAALLGNSQDGIRRELEAGGYLSRDKVPRQVAAWIGDAGSSQGGLLNAAPWNVPPGAP